MEYGIGLDIGWDRIWDRGRDGVEFIRHWFDVRKSMH